MKSIFYRLLLSGLVFAYAGRARPAEPLEQAFQSALLAEEARRDLNAAIRGYEAVVAQVDAQREIAATAVFRLGECYRKLGRTNEAVAQFRRLVRDFSGEATLTRLSRENLLALGALPIELQSTNAAPRAVSSDHPDATEEAAEVHRLRTLFDRSPDLLNSARDGATPLIAAAAKGQLLVVRALLSWGADVNRSVGGSTPLSAAAENGHKAVVEALLDAKADPNRIGRRSTGSNSKRGSTALLAATSRGYEVVVEMLLSRGAKPQVDSAEPALFAAVTSGHTNLIERLVRAGADPNFEMTAEGSGYRTALEAAVDAQQRESSRVLVRLGAVARGTPGAGRERHPLAKAIQFNGFPVDWIEELLRAVPKEGFPPGFLDEMLWSCVSTSGRDHFIPLLFGAGASANTIDGRGVPLVIVAASKSAHTFEAVLAGRPDPNATSPNATTALHVAVEVGSTNNVASLLKAGADPNRLDQRGLTPLEMVRMQLGRTLGQTGSTGPGPGRRTRSPTTGTGVPAPVTSGAEVVLGPNPTPLANGRVPVPTEAAVISLGSAVGAASGTAAPMRFSGSTGASPPSAEEAIWLRIEAMLLAAGAREDVARRLAVHWRKGAETIAFHRRVADNPAPSLADFLLMTLSTQKALWADLAGIRIHRLAADGRRESSTPIQKDWWNSSECSWSSPLEWGDVIEMPETDRVLGIRAPALAGSTIEALMRCAGRRVHLAVKGETVALDLWPARRLDSAPMGGALPSSPTVASITVASPTGNLVGTRAADAPAPMAPMAIYSCYLRQVLEASQRLRVSSDLTRVRVERPTAGQAWTLDLENDADAAQFWLLGGDRIDVPEKRP